MGTAIPKPFAVLQPTDIAAKKKEEHTHGSNRKNNNKSRHSIKVYASIFEVPTNSSGKKIPAAVISRDHGGLTSK